MVCVGCVIVLSYSLWRLVCVIISEGFWLIIKTMMNINNHKCTSDALNSATIHVWLSHHKSTQPNMHGIAIPLLHAHSHSYWTENMEEKQPPNKITHSVLDLLTLAAAYICIPVNPYSLPV